MKKALAVLLVIAIAMTSIFAEGAKEEKPYPSKPVTAIIGWSAGGGADIVSEHLQKCSRSMLTDRQWSSRTNLMQPVFLPSRSS